MNIYEILILSFIEILSTLNIWGKMDSKIKGQILKKTLLVSILLVLVSILNYFKVNNGFIIIYGAIILLSLILFEIPKRYILFEFTTSLGIIIIIQLLLMYLIITIKGEIEYSFISGLIINVILFIVSLIIKKLIPINRLLTIYKRNFKTLNILIVFLGIPLVVFTNLWKNNEKIYLTNLKPILLYIIVWSILGMYFIYNNIKFLQKKRELKIQSSYTNILKELVGDLRKIQHDHKNHLTTILGMIENEYKESNRIEKYIENIIGKSRNIDKSLNIKDPVLNAIVYNKMAQAESNNIRFLIEFKEEIPNYEIEGYELVEILGNLLDNAIEANENYEKGNKKIVLILGIENNKKFIMVRNTTDLVKLPSIENIFKEGYSTKKGKPRGYGFNNVKDIVKSYKGTLEFSIENDLVTIKILL